MVDLYQQTLEKREYIEQLGYEYVEMWECEFMRLNKSNKDLQTFLQSIQPPLYRKTTMTEEEIVQAVLNDQIFGCIECDIRVPEDLKPHFEHVEEMPPIFKMWTLIDLE